MRKLLAFLLIPLIFNLPILGYAQTCNGGGGGGGIGLIPLGYVKDWPIKGTAPDTVFQTYYWEDVTGHLVQTVLPAETVTAQNDYYVYVQAYGRPHNSVHPIYGVVVNGSSIFSHAMFCTTAALPDQDYILIPPSLFRPTSTVPLQLTFLNPDYPGPFPKAIFFYSAAFIVVAHGTSPGNSYHCS